MLTEKYLRISAKRGKCSDEHFGCMTKWVRERRDPALTGKCQAAARKFEKALEAELRYLEKLEHLPKVTQRIALVRELQTLLARDLHILTSH